MLRSASLLLALLLPAAGRTWPGEDTDFRRAQYLYMHLEYKLATEALGDYLAKHPRSERAGQARLLLAESHYQLKEYDKAAQHFERFLSDEPGSERRAEVLQRLVKLGYLCRKFQESLAHAETFLKENRARLGKPDAPPALPELFQSALYYAGESAYALKQTDAARKHWEQLRASFPRSKLMPDAAEGLGWIAFEAGRFAEAHELFSLTAAAPDHPKAAAAQVQVARALERLKGPDEALAALDRVPQLTGAKEQAREAAFWRASILLRAKRFGQAASAYQALVAGFSADPGTGPAVAEAAAEALNGGAAAEALKLAELYLSGFAQGAERPQAARLKARALAALNRPAEALNAARAAVKEAEALPAGERKSQLERPAALMLLGELAGPEGRAAYEAVLKDHGGSRFAATARYQLAYWAGKDGRLDEALAHAATLVKELPAGDAQAAELRRKALFAAADFAFRKEDYAGAEAYLKEYCALPATQADPAASQLPLALLRQAWCRYKAQAPAEAVKLLDAAFALRPDGALKSEMLYLRGLSRLPAREGASAADGAGALADFSALAGAAPDSEFTAHACFRAAQWLAPRAPAEATPWLDRLIANNSFARLPVCADALLLRARLRYDARQYAEALTDLEALLRHPELKDRAAGARLLKGLCLEALPGRSAEAEAACTEAIQAGPADAAEVREALRRRAQLRFQAQRYEEAQADLAAFLGQWQPQAGDTARLEAAVVLALCKKNLKDAAGAQALLEKLARLPLTGAPAFEAPFQLGNLGFEAGQHLAAVEWYQKALGAAAGVKDLPREALAATRVNLAWSYQRAGRPQEAERAFAALLELDPAGPYAAEARAQRGRLLAESGNLESALAVWKELLEKNAADPLAERVRFEMGVALAKAGRFADGAAAFEQYLGRHPQGSLARESWCGLAECLLQTQKPEPAKEAFLKALGEKGLDAELDEVGERVVLGLAELALGQGDANECKKLALRVVIDRPGSRWLDAALYLSGRASEALAEPEKAIGYYRRLLSDCPNSARAATARERLKALGAPAP